MLQNLSDLDFGLSRSIKVKCDSVIGLSLYAFLLMFNNNLWPNSAPLRDIMLRNLSDIEFDHSRSNVMMTHHAWRPMICTVITCLTLTA